jgi:MFS family permease
VTLHPLSYTALLRMRPVRRLMAATALARLGGRMLTLVVILYALDRFGSAELVGWLSFAMFAPGLVASPLLGVWLDRFGATRGIMIDLGISAVLTGGMAGAGLLDIATPPLLLCLVALFSLTSPLSAAGIRSLLPALVPPAALGRANALDTMTHAVVEVAGPALGALSVALTGGPVALLLITLLFAGASLFLRGLPDGRRAPGTAGAPSGYAALLREAVGSVVLVMRDRTLRGLAVSYALYQAAWGILLVAVPVVLSRALGASDQRDLVVGTVWAVSGVAGGLGALMAGLRTWWQQERALIAWGMLGTALAIYPLAATGPLGLMVAVAAAGFLSGPTDVGLLTLRQRRTDPAFLGRVLAVSMSLNICGLPIGSALGGVLAAYGDQALFAAAASASVLAAITCRVLIPAEADRTQGPA